MEVYRTKDGQVSKYIHDNGAETAIKTVSSCNNVFNSVTNTIEPVFKDRQKYSLFISSSVGCPIGCRFCYLTSKKYPYYKLSSKQIIDNTKEALTEIVEFNPDIRKKYVKLCWMGMGDAFLLPMREVRHITEELIDWIIGNKNFAFGLDGVDVGTTLPRNAYGWQYQLALLNEHLTDRYRKNPHNTERNRSMVRLFYSLHSVLKRKALIPSSILLDNPLKDLSKLSTFREQYGINVILHQMFLEGINDSNEDLENLVNAINDKIDHAELRILRFNECENSIYKESHKFNEIVKYCSDHLPNIKYQISAGSEISASCGQFLCKVNRKA